MLQSEAEEAEKEIVDHGNSGEIPDQFTVQITPSLR